MRHLDTNTITLHLQILLDRIVYLQRKLEGEKARADEECRWADQMLLEHKMERVLKAFLERLDQSERK